MGFIFYKGEIIVEKIGDCCKVEFLVIVCKEKEWVR